MIDTCSNQTCNATIEAAQTHNDALQVQEWETALTTLKDRLEFARSQ
ncbi:MAG: hypothetical protein AAGC88_10815 [Bacteroidota bacterium]